tara:strand:- start:19692 stop:20855 length:1164 start_codon:yes stop_codon:yes gene_type:complete
MFQTTKKIELQKLDFVTLSIFLLLSIIGLFFLATASLNFSETVTGSPLSMFYRQFFHLFLGILLGITIFLIPLETWEKIDRYLLLFGVFLLLMVFIPGIGQEVKGANRWIRFAGYGLQPAEVMKFISIIYISAYAVRQNRELQSNWFAFFRPTILIFLILSLILLQPDLGSSVIIFISVLGILFLAGVKLKQFLLIMLIGVIGIIFLIYFEPFRWERIISFLNPWDFEYDEGFQLTLSLMSIGRGDWFGVGPGQSLMKMGYLPDAHTDFIFSIIVEEFGLITAIVLISFLFGLSFRFIKMARAALSKGLLFGFYVSMGVAILIGLQTFINIGVSTGLLPTKGLTLPFVSYGGTHMLLVCAMIGLALRVDYETKISLPQINIPRRADF